MKNRIKFRTMKRFFNINFTNIKYNNSKNNNNFI